MHLVEITAYSDGDDYTIDLPYAEKRAHYDRQNLLARSLDEKAYDHNPGFRRFLEASGLPLRMTTSSCAI